MKQKHNKMNMGLVFFVVALFVVSTAMSAMGKITTNKVVETDNLNRPPTVQFILNGDDNCHQRTFRPGQKIYFMVMGSDPDGDELTYTIEWSRVGPTEPVNDDCSYWYTVDHTYSSMGIYHATCTAKDGRGGEDSYSINVRVTKPKSKPLNHNPMQFDLLERFPLLAQLIQLPLFDSIPVFQ